MADRKMIYLDDAIKALKEIDLYKNNMIGKLGVLKSMLVLLDMPSAQPRKGKWIVTNKFEDCYYAKCNECKVTQVFYHNKALTNYCPNCGADMRGKQNGH